MPQRRFKLKTSVRDDVVIMSWEDLLTCGERAWGQSA
jgi:hypothetical protein